MKSTGETSPLSTIRYGVDYYIISFKKTARVLSNAPYNGGVAKSRMYINRTVPIDYDSDPSVEIPGFLEEQGIGRESVTVTLTACDVTRAVHRNLRHDGFTMDISITAGTGNALSIGGSGSETRGTVNIAVITDAEMEDSAAINLFQSVVEAKAQAFNDCSIKDSMSDNLIAPGTSTDTLSLFFIGGGQHFEYGGRLSEIGGAASQAVHSMLKHALSEPCR